MDEKAKENDEATSEYVRAGPMPVALQGGKRRLGKESFDPTPLPVAIFTYMTYALLTLLGHIRDFFRFIGLIKTCKETVSRDVSPSRLSAH